MDNNRNMLVGPGKETPRDAVTAAPPPTPPDEKGTTPRGESEQEGPIDTAPCCCTPEKCGNRHVTQGHAGLAYLGGEDPEKATGSETADAP